MKRKLKKKPRTIYWVASEAQGGRPKTMLEYFTSRRAAQADAHTCRVLGFFTIVGTVTKGRP